MYARVVVDTGSASSIDSLTYEIPDGLTGSIGVGDCVLVPLGPRQAVGYVIGLEEQSPVAKTRPIIARVESPLSLTDETLRFARWMSDRYLCPLPRTVAAMLPGAMQSKIKREDEPGPDGKPTRVYRLVPPSGKPRVMSGVRVADGIDPESLLPSLSAKQAEALRVIRDIGGDIPLLELTKRHGLSPSALSALRKKGLLLDVQVIVRRRPDYDAVARRHVQLTAEQQVAVDAITRCIDAGEHSVHLLHGVTASGKTEVYMRCIEHALSLGKTAIILLPEIAITTQVMNIFKARFGDAAAVLHSALSDGERCDEWVRAAQGEGRVVLGARSALFAPLQNLGLIVVDEEHEPSYKQDSPPRYHAREAAIERARQCGAAAVLGSATPSVESYQRVSTGEFRLITMHKRVENRPLPVVHVADLREEWQQGKATIFSSALEQRIRDRLERREQVILLQNRRAFSTFILCRDCGFVPECPNCAVSLKLHSATRTLKCHHCGFEVPAPHVCPKCEGSRVKTFGIGTQRVEEETRKLFAEARVLRMDRDTTSRKGAHAAILREFRRGDADILVGTQMIAKGLDFPNVTLVGMISADTSLHFPDYSASERTFQLISQVSGRSGRGERPGEVVVQTFDPDQYAVKCAVEHDYPCFYAQEIEERHAAGYPPFTSLINVVSRDADYKAAESRLQSLVTAIRSGPMSARRGVEILGPQAAVLPRLRGEYRFHLVLRSASRDSLLALLRDTFERSPNLRRNLAVDVDPVSMI